MLQVSVESLPSLFDAIRVLESVRDRLPSPLEPNQLANKQGVANQRAREFAGDFLDRRKESLPRSSANRKLRAPFRSEAHRKVLQTLWISGGIFRTAKLPSELTCRSLPFRERKKARPAGFEPATCGLEGEATGTGTSNRLVL